ncbi:MAG: hypothetical protein ABWZ76_01390 [Acidimicrobiales bacterium]
MAARRRTVVLDRHFNGPSGSANGGYTCGVAAEALTDGPVEVELRLPPPLDVLLDVVEVDGGVELQEDGRALAVARPWTGEVEVPMPPSPSQVSAGVAGLDLASYAREHPFAHCFTCGPARAEGDGLRIFPGPLVGTGMVAWPWTPASSTAGDEGLVARPIVWAALDCPSGQCWINAPDGSSSGPAVLGRLAVRIDRRPAPGEALVVAGWQERAEGRKRHSGAAIWTAAGEAVASAKATWVVLDRAQAAAFGVGS